MPQLDVVSYLTQYVWVLLAFFILFFLIVLGILPVFQQQLVLRTWAEEVLKNNVGQISIRAEGRPTIIIFRPLLNKKW